VFSAVETRADAEFTEELTLKGFSRPVKAYNVRNIVAVLEDAIDKRAA
jgi:class 3 adenylate cyclase